MGDNIYKLEKREKQRDRNKAPSIKERFSKAWYNDPTKAKETKHGNRHAHRGRNGICHSRAATAKE